MNLKKAIRKEIKAKRDALTVHQMQEASKAVNEKLFARPEWQAAGSIFVYVSYNNEVDTYSIIAKALETGKRVFVPKVDGEEMHFYEIADVDADLACGAYGIMEPITQGRDISHEGLMIMPGVAFDENRNRLGYGGGYYDRYLSWPNTHYKIAIAYELQMVESVPTEECDVKPDCIITPERVI